LALPASAGVLEATTAPVVLSGNLQLGNEVNPNGDGGQPVDTNISALIVTNGTGAIGGTPIFAYTPNSTANSYAGLQSSGGSVTGLTGLQTALSDAYKANWNFQAPFTTVSGLLQFNPSYTTGIYAAAGNTAGPFVGVGYNTPSEYSGGASFGGVATSSLPSTAVLLRQTYAGDNSLSGTVTAYDFQGFFTGYLNALKNPASTQDWSQGDYMYTGHTSAYDFQLYFTNYLDCLKGTAPQLANPVGSISGGGPVGNASATPEPASVILLAGGLAGIGALAGLARRGAGRAKN
jgi:hypothetical protein